MVGTQIGAYKLIQKIGEGGFGTVWMADQHEPLRRRVALKVIRAGLDTDEVIARFEVERQALALMDHPNIARVVDAGATASGRPYFVMELVRGVPITRYCDENRLTAGARLQLFLAVCSAVQHAHQKGIIHRDLKPSNILVTLHDGAPVPKIIDFGIAKATDKQLTEKTLVTQFHAFVGTPVYTSPEQMEMSGLDVDTRSDIYSLGVLLYELLAGRPPFDPEALVKAGLDAMRRTIREVDPPRPSHRLGTLTETDRTSVAQQRGTDAAKLALLLRGDVDWIVMRCLEKDRTRRYDTAAALAADIQHHLRHEPILARPPSEIYRVMKFVRRHRLGVATAATIIVLLVAGLVTASTLWMRERVAHRRAAAAEASETRLRQQTESARQLETRRVARTALALAGELLDRGETASGLAQLVYAARKDPANPTIAPRLASLLTTRSFLTPHRLPLHLPAPAVSIAHLEQGRKIGVVCADGTLGLLEAATGEFSVIRLPSPVASDGRLGQSGQRFAVLCRDNAVRVVDTQVRQIVHEFRFGQKAISKSFLRAETATFAVRLENQELHLCDASTGWSRSLALDDRTWWLLSPDGRRLITCPLPWREIKICDAGSGEAQATLAVSDGAFKTAVISADSRRLASLQAKAPTGELQLQIWSVSDGRPISDPSTLQEKASTEVPSVFFSPDGRFLVLWGRRTLEMRDGVTGRLLAPPVPHVPASFSDWTFTPDLRSLLTWTRGTITIWDLTDFRQKSQLPTQEGGIQYVRISGDSRLALVASRDGLARVWDLESTRLIAELPSLQLAAPACDLSPDGSTIVVGTEAGELLQLRIGRAIQPLSLPWAGQRRPSPFLEEPPARVLSFRHDRATVFDLATGLPSGGGFAYPQPEKLRPLANNPDISRRQRWALGQRFDGETELWEVWELTPTGVARINPLREVPSQPQRYFFRPDGEQVAFVWGSSLRVWNTHTGLPAGPTIQFPGQVFYGVDYGANAFSPDGRRIAVGGQRGEARIFEIASGKETLRLPVMRESTVSVVAFNPDGTRILVANWAGDAQLFDAVSGEATSPRLAHSERPRGAFSPDGKWLATTCGRTISLWDGHSGVLHGQIEETEGVRGIDWSADSTRLVRTSRSGPIRVWDIGTLLPVTDLMVHPGVLAVDANFSSDGRFVAVETFRDLPDAPGQVGFFDVWSIPPPLPAGKSTPEWLLDLATLCAGKRIDTDGKVRPVPPLLEGIEKVRRSVAALPPGEPYAEWGRWFLEDPATRSIAPGFTITPAEADILAAELAPREAPAAVTRDAKP
ncbi:MAG: protein kinase [Verrucomicrobia bacterium]|nr:protein kinase [Verrucomicrobiota bacterium]